MAMNPMQRRARNSFLIGFLVALIIMAVVVLAILSKYRKVNDSLEALKKKQVRVYVAADDLKSGRILNFDEDFTEDTVQTSVDKDTIISPDDWEFRKNDDPNGPIITKITEDGQEIKRKVMLKVDVPKGEIVTKDMITYEGEEILDSERIIEYNMLILPSTLKNGDYIDIRLLLPTGKDFVVLSKKRVLGCNETTVWLQIKEEEMLLLNNAIVESYTIQGSKLYATIYAEAGMQAALTTTYLPSTDVIMLIDKNPNILQKAREALVARYDVDRRVQDIDNTLKNYEGKEDQLVQKEVNTEVTALKAAREEYVKGLEGGEDVGYSR